MEIKGFRRKSYKTQRIPNEPAARPDEPKLGERKLQQTQTTCLPVARELRKCARICELVFARFTRICARFTAPFVTVPLVPI